MMPSDPEEKIPEQESPKEPDARAADGADEALAKAKQQAEQYLDSWKRCQADFSNLKRRTDQEKLEMGKYANAQLIMSLLPVLDDFNRAFSNMSPETAGSDWAKGFKLIQNKLNDILQVNSLCRTEAVGQEFDPNLHEAMVHCPGKEGIVVQELRCGYKIGDKVIRPSQVMVGKGEEEPPKPPADAKAEPKQGKKSQQKSPE